MDFRTRVRLAILDRVQIAKQDLNVVSPSLFISILAVINNRYFENVVWLADILGGENNVEFSEDNQIFQRE